MASLDYEQRKHIIAEWLKGLLSRYEVPRNFDANVARQEMIDMVEDINSEMPDVNKDLLAHILSKVAQHARKNNTGRTWPTIKTLVKGVQDHAERLVIADMDHEATRPIDFDGDLINAKRIKNREPVGEWYVFGKGAQDLLDKGLVTKQDLEVYQAIAS